MKRLLGQWSAEEGVDLRIWDWGGLLGFEMTGRWFIPKPEDLRDILAVIAHGRGDDEFVETDETETIEYDPSDPRYRCG